MRGNVWLQHIFHRGCSCPPKIAGAPWPYMCKACSMCLRHHVSRPHNTGCRLIVAAHQQARRRPTRPPILSPAPLAMHVTQLNRECLLHLFSFLDKDSRRSFSLTCRQLREVFLDPQLWNLLHFSSPSQLRKDNFVLGPSLRCLAVCWYSSRVKVCNIEDWLKSSFQKDICRSHAGLVSSLLAHVCYMCPNLLSLSLSGCGHVTDQDVVSVLRSCRKLRRLHLENCVRITDGCLRGVAAHGGSLEEVRVDFCRNITREGLQAVRETRPSVQLRADMSVEMIPDRKPEVAASLRSALQRVLMVS